MPTPVVPGAWQGLADLPDPVDLPDPAAGLVGRAASPCHLPARTPFVSNLARVE